MSKCDQTNKLIEIGAQLKQVRETRQIPLHQITSTTLIAERHLKAIEAGDLEQLPEPIYIQGFIRKYGQELGLEQLAEDFPLEGAPQSKPLSLPKTELRPLHLYALYIGVIGIAVSLLANFFNQSKVSPLTTGKSNLSKSALLKSAPQGSSLGQIGANKILLALPSPDQSSDPIAKSVGSEDLSTSQKPLKLGISTTAEAWLSVNVDGKLQFEGTLPSGANRNWSADQEIKVLAGNAGAIVAVFNDQSVGALGKSGEVVEKSFNLTSQSPAQLPDGAKPDPQNDSTRVIPANQLPDRSASIIR
jgi:cytoskeleton protein RodZ